MTTGYISGIAREYRTEKQINRDKMINIEDPSNIVNRVSQIVKNEKDSKFALLRRGHHWVWWPQEHIELPTQCLLGKLSEKDRTLPLETFEDWDYTKCKKAQEEDFKKR